jgi:hypothetical protein
MGGRRRLQAACRGEGAGDARVCLRAGQKREVVPVPGFPKLVVEAGSYPCVIEHPDGQRLAAVLDLVPGHSPRGEVFDWPVPERGGIRTVPQPVEQFPLLKCSLRVRWEVLLVEAAVQALLPGQASLRASLAVAGSGLLADPGKGFAEASVQITEGHRLFGRAPLTKVMFPARCRRRGRPSSAWRWTWTQT